MVAKRRMRLQTKYEISINTSPLGPSPCNQKPVTHPEWKLDACEHKTVRAPAAGALHRSQFLVPRSYLLSDPLTCYWSPATTRNLSVSSAFGSASEGAPVITSEALFVFG